MKKQFLTLTILASLAMHAFAYDFQSGNLLYTIISNDPFWVSLNGHVDGTSAQGELIIPETVTYENNVFTVVEISDSAFMHCNGLTGALNLPTTIKTIGKRAFAYCTGFSELNLNEGLLEICEEAFRGCSGFTGTLNFPETVVYIKYGAFHGCDGFSGNLVLPNSVRELGNTQNKKYCSNNRISVVSNCFDRLVLSQSLDTIGPYCFYRCLRLQGDLVIPNSVKAIYCWAFSECRFWSLTLGDSLTLIDSDAFSYCGNIQGTVVIPENCELGDNAFIDCIGIAKVVILSHNSRLPNGVFRGCTNLSEVDISEGLVHTGGDTFWGCHYLRRVHLPESLRTIGVNCFMKCTRLEEINFPDGITSIELQAFRECSSLTHIKLPANLREIHQGAFGRCSGLKGELIIPDLVQRIGNDGIPNGQVPFTFEGCNRLTSIVFGDSINYIEESAFVGPQLDTLVIKAKTPPVLVRYEYLQFIMPFPTDIPIIVPCGTLEAYQNAEVWNSYTNIIEDCDNGFNFSGSEWYYEILNGNGNITYQHLEYAADTTINDKKAKVIVRTNQIYDKKRQTEVTHEYVYKEDHKVYWWNKALQEFTTLYDFAAEAGDEWEIKVGVESLIMHVDTVLYNEYEGNLFKILRVSDEQNVFSGDIICGIGHRTSFFPERLMKHGKPFNVEGFRCYWQDGSLVFKYANIDCDAIYEQIHHGLVETTDNMLMVYPNPADGLVHVEVSHGAAPQEYRITNLMGQTLMSGTISDQTIDVSTLPKGLYFITLDNQTIKLMKQ